MVGAIYIKCPRNDFAFPLVEENTQHQCSRSILVSLENPKKCQSIAMMDIKLSLDCALCSSN